MSNYIEWQIYGTTNTVETHLSLGISMYLTYNNIFNILYTSYT